MHIQWCDTAHITHCCAGAIALDARILDYKVGWLYLTSFGLLCTMLRVTVYIGANTDANKYTDITRENLDTYACFNGGFTAQ